MKKAKIILDKEDVTILTQTNKNEEYFFYRSLTRRNNYILRWLFTMIRELNFTIMKLNLKTGIFHPCQKMPIKEIKKT